MTQSDNSEFEGIYRHMKSHRVFYTVSWELPEDQRGTHEHMVHDPDGEVAKRIVTERIASGLPIDYQFLSDQHDFGEGRLASVHQSMPCEQTPSEVLRMVADQLDDEMDCMPMTIRMLLLTSPDGNQFRLAAHTLTHYYRDANMQYTRVNAVWDVKGTPEEIDAYFHIGHAPHPSLQCIDEYEDDDGTLLT